MKILITVFLSLTITPSLKAQVNVQDSLALVDLYNSTDGPNWIDNTNWLTKNPVSTWFGITVSGGRVTIINSYRDSLGYGLTNNLKGSIPFSLENLTNLQRLTLSENQLSGTIPSSLGNLTNLRLLDLGNNQLGGSIPSTLGNLNKVQYLYLFNNQLSGSIPSTLGNLTNLLWLGLEDNNLSSSIPSTLGNLINLQNLQLYSNQLSGSIPSSLGNLTNLDHLELSYNELSDSIPSTLGNLTKLYRLDLEDNQLSGFIPSSLGNITNLQQLVLDNNQLSGSIPSSLGRLTKLNYCQLYNNQLNGTIPSSFINLVNLKKLDLFNNLFTFAGMEGIVNLAKGKTVNGLNNDYAPQANVPLYNNGNTLSVSVCGTPVIDTFRWYKDSVLVATKVADSTYAFTSNGKYWVVATNAIATELTLYSDTINIAGLPIKDITLTAQENNGQVLLQWQTIGEVNTTSFTIQRSTDGKTFTDLATKEAVGSGNNGYSFSPPSPLKGVTYYRIKVVDKDGSFSYSNVALLTINDSRLTIYPNPSKDNVTISGNHIACVQVIDNMGRVVKVFLLNDATNPKLIVSNLLSGVYHLRIQTIDGKVSEVGFVKE